MQNLQAGIQMYSLREFTKNLEDLKRTMERVAEIGYKTIQVSGMGVQDARDIQRVMEENDLTVISTHESWPRVKDETQAVIDDYRTYGAKHIAIGILPREYQDLAGLERFLQEYSEVEPLLKEAGMDFSYHNHNHELVKYAGKTWLEHLYERASGDTLKAEIDTYWITAGGGDPAEWVQRYGDRMPLLHVKDMCITVEREQHFAPVGEGNLNWKAILDAARESQSIQYVLVEQDSFYGDDPFEAVAKSYKNLKKMGVA